MVAGLWGVAERVEGLLISDQVQERDCGAVTDRLREDLRLLALAHPEMLALVDSRVRIGEFQGVSLKPNRAEAQAALGAGDEQSDEDLGRALSQRAGRPVFLTRGAEGMLMCTSEKAVAVPAPPVAGPLDIVGAGDSASAGLILSLCAGASAVEAAVVANLVASITVQQLGTTGTASPEQVRRRFLEHADLYAEF
jgi:bifunctional ADP-heptose synthase (sugar kinase/adenylyltransferase)